MFEDHSSSQDDNFHGLSKKIQYKGQIDQSQDAECDESSQQIKDQHRKSYNRKISELKAQPSQSKNKMIKKNSVSAKMSRQRKKIYIDLLQQKADALKNQIYKTTQQILRQKEGIMAIIRQSNPEKGTYIEQKISQSKRLVKLLEQYEQLNAQHTKQASSGKQTHQNLHAFNQLNVHGTNKITEIAVKNQANLHYQHHYEKPQSQKQALGSLHRQAIMDEINPKITKQEHQKKAQAYINSFSYKFGFKGFLKSAVFQLQKQRWYELLIDQKNLSQSSQKRVQLQMNINNFKNCINQLNRSSQRMQYLSHKIQAKINNGSICKLLLDKKFLTQIATQQAQQKSQQ